MSCIIRISWASELADGRFGGGVFEAAWTAVGRGGIVARMFLYCSWPMAEFDRVYRMLSIRLMRA